MQICDIHLLWCFTNCAQLSLDWTVSGLQGTKTYDGMLPPIHPFLNSLDRENWLFGGRRSFTQSFPSFSECKHLAGGNIQICPGGTIWEQSYHSIRNKTRKLRFKCYHQVFLTPNANVRVRQGILYAQKHNASSVLGPSADIQTKAVGLKLSSVFSVLCVGWYVPLVPLACVGGSFVQLNPTLHQYHMRCVHHMVHPTSETSFLLFHTVVPILEEAV